MFAQASTESEDDDGVDAQNVAHVLLDHKVLNSKPAHAQKKKHVSNIVRGGGGLLKEYG